jgi:hypothetical protein
MASIGSCILRPPSMVSAMVETSQAASGRTSDLPGLAIYSVALFLLMLAWAYFLA